MTSKFIILFYTLFIVFAYEPYVFAKRVFVLHHETGMITEYNPVDLHPENQIKISEYNGYQEHKGPKYQFRSPTKDLLINQSGNILYYEDRATHQRISGKKLNVRKLCYWNGKKWHHAEVSYPEEIYFISVPFLDEKQDVFYWYVNSGLENSILSFNGLFPLSILYRASLDLRLLGLYIMKDMAITGPRKIKLTS